MGDLLKEERQQLILKALQENKKVTVQELSQRFGTSEVTIRRDLADLAASGKVRRAHRGALVVNPTPPEPPVVQRMSLEQEWKESIARTAARLVSEGDSLFIGSGSTMNFFARQLASFKRLTVVTNSISVASELASAEGEITVVLTGGVLRSAELSVLGHIAEQSLREVRVERVFMGAQALSLESGWTTDHLPEVSTTRQIIQMGHELVVLVDHNKLGGRAAAYIAPVTSISTLVTDREVDPVFVEQLRELGIRVLVAGSQDGPKD
jgi:DeoR/GlpR family transcriptional regulator of sugar metabolism